MNKQTKRGFTVVELVVVIAIIAILAAVLIPTFSNLIKRANISRDTQLIRNLNTALVADSAKNGKHTTMQSALDAAELFGYDVAKINASATDNEILWDGKNDVFCYFNADSTEENKIEYIPEFPGTEGADPVDYFIISKDIDDNYSTYYTGTAATITTDKGFDAGKSSVANITYDRSSATEGQTVVIRTNSANTTLTINAEHDTVNHYGNVGKVDAQKIDMNCYNEYGTAAYVKVTEGKVVAKAGGTISVVFANNTDSTKVAVAKESTGTIERGLTTVQVVDENNFANYAVHLEYSADGETPYTADAIETIATTVVETAIEKENYKGDVYILQNGEAIDTGRYATLAEFRDEVNGLNGKEANTFAGYTVSLQVNVDLASAEWIPIGTKDNPFSGFFDGNNKTISNLKITTDRKYNGLFGYVVSDTYADLTGIYNEQNYTFDSSKYSSNLYGASVADLTISNFEIKNTAQKYCAAVIGYAECVHMSNIQVKNGTVTGFKGVAGIVAEYNNAAIINCTTGYIQKDDINEADVTIDASDYQVAGITAGYTHYTTTPALKGDSVIVGCNNYATIKKHDALTGYEAGIVSYWQADDLGSTYISGCHNYGLIVSDNTTKDGYYNAAYHVSGIANGTNVEVIFDCSNQGSFSCVGAQSHVNGIAGNVNSGKKVVNCSNYADITATLDASGSINGVYAGGDNNTSFGNINYGTLNNTNGNKYDISNGIQSLKITSSDLDSNLTIENLNAVISNKYALNTSYTSISIMDLDLVDKTGELVIPNGIKSISANTVICSTINTPESLKTISMKGINYTYDSNISNALTFNGDGNTITVNAGVTIGSIALGGNNNNVVINGNVGAISILGNGTGLNITNNENATLGHLGIVGSTAEVTLTNYGSMNGATGHVIGVEAACKLTINLYGSITASSGFAILLYDGCVGEINAYAGSTVTGGFAPYRGNGRTTILYQDGASIDGKSWTTQKSTEHHVIVAEMN